MYGLKTGYKVKLIPFKPEHAETVCQWFYAPAYKLFFRDFDTAISPEDFKEFDKIMGRVGVGMLMIVDKDSEDVLGMMTHLCLKKKSGVIRIGILLDKEKQHMTLAIESLIILGDFLYNRLGYKKLVIEYLASDKHIIRIAEQGGWIREAVLIREALVDDDYVDEVKYYMFKEKYDELYGSYFEGSEQEE